MEIHDPSFGSVIRKVRKERGLSLDQLCEMYNKRFSAKLNKRTLSRYENNLQDPLFSTVRNFSELLDISVDFMLSASSNEKEILYGQEKLINAMWALNMTGRELLLKYVDFLLTEPEYRLDEHPEK